jgi:hypothetical protein
VSSGPGRWGKANFSLTEAKGGLELHKLDVIAAPGPYSPKRLEKDVSLKFVSSLLYESCPSGRVEHPSSGPTYFRQHYMLWP